MSWYLSSLVCSFILVISFGVPLAHSDIRDDINNNKALLNKLEATYAKLNLNVIDIKKEIKELENKLEIAKENEKTFRKAMDESWTAIVEHEKALDKLAEAEKNLSDKKNELQITYQTRNSVLTRMNDLENLILDLEVAEPKERKFKSPNELIGFVLDGTCRTLIKNNINSTCPTYEMIETLYPGSPCIYSGKWCLDYYRQIGGFHYFVDPPAEVIERIKIIEIRHDFKRYHLQDSNGYDNEERILKYGLGRYVEHCRVAHIDSSNWIPLAGDTILYLLDNCDPDSSNLDIYSTISLNNTVHDISTSYKYKLEQWQQQVIKDCGTKICLYNQNQTKAP